ncbi:MAG: dehydrogenase [Planctomycetia bacterium]|nr:dehydrogenase [Planctomycetia bacterium]
MRYSLSAFAVLFVSVILLAQKLPRGHDKMPGPALSPAEAIKKMKVPEGFTVELVASEPDIVNPIGMTFDEKGRVWITESLEYPKRETGLGRDRVKVIEIGADGKASKITTFAEGLNIPSGVAVGHGGVWVANAPDILFYKTDAEGKAVGKPEVVVTGFGRTDTHELPNSLTWGPDGWLYGWNGVFNFSHVKYRGKEYKFTCAIFRIHPQTRDFELFCEGTSNPWGIAINENGDFFASACVIDHLWHLTETGYYIRQGGPYPPFTWPARSIVKHKHQKAAYCGIHYFDSDAFPESYRGKLFMGNIHGGCINVDKLQRDGATYFGTSDTDFLTANDPWFMPVVQKTGPDGSLYILDWYDRYHCYQDANRDPKGIDRLHGRLYRVRYKDTPRVQLFDLSQESDAQLIERLGSGNVYYRDIAQRLLTERLMAGKRVPGLETIVQQATAPRKQRLHGLWALIGGGRLNNDLHTALLKHDDATFRAWGVRAAGNAKKVDVPVAARLAEMLGNEKSPDVLVQLAIANNKLNLGGVSTFLKLLERAPGDTLLPHVVWQNMHSLLENNGQAFANAVNESSTTTHLADILPRAVERILASKRPQTAALATLYDVTRRGKSANIELARKVLDAMASKVRTGELDADAVAELKKRLAAPLALDLDDDKSGFRFDAALLLAAFRDEKGLNATRKLLADGSESVQLRALEILASIKDAVVLEQINELMNAKRSLTFRAAVLSALGRFEEDRVASVVMAEYEAMPDDLKPRAIDLLTQRETWSKTLLQQIAARKLAASVIGVNQARRLLASKDKELVTLTTKHWGTLREDRNPERERVVKDIRDLLDRTTGDAKRGLSVYKNLCGQCHKIHGEGAEVGPDITVNGRATFDQLLSNVFDPSLVIGPGYNAVTVFDKKGRSISGLLAEDGPTRVVLKVQGGKQEIIARSAIEKMEVSKLSLMPEGVEKQLKPQEIADLMAFLCLDRHPNDPKARTIPGTPKRLSGEK